MSEPRRYQAPNRPSSAPAHTQRSHTGRSLLAGPTAEAPPDWLPNRGLMVIFPHGSSGGTTPDTHSGERLARTATDPARTGVGVATDASTKRGGLGSQGIARPPPNRPHSSAGGRAGSPPLHPTVVSVMTPVSASTGTHQHPSPLDDHDSGPSSRGPSVADGMAMLVSGLDDQQRALFLSTDLESIAASVLRAAATAAAAPGALNRSTAALPSPRTFVRLELERILAQLQDGQSNGAAAEEDTPNAPITPSDDERGAESEMDSNDDECCVLIQPVPETYVPPTQADMLRHCNGVRPVPVRGSAALVPLRLVRALQAESAAEAEGSDAEETTRDTGSEVVPCEKEQATGLAAGTPGGEGMEFVEDDGDDSGCDDAFGDAFDRVAKIGPRAKGQDDPSAASPKSAMQESGVEAGVDICSNNPTLFDGALSAMTQTTQADGAAAPLLQQTVLSAVQARLLQPPNEAADDAFFPVTSRPPMEGIVQASPAVASRNPPEIPAATQIRRCPPPASTTQPPPGCEYDLHSSPHSADDMTSRGGTPTTVERAIHPLVVPCVKHLRRLLSDTSSGLFAAILWPPSVKAPLLSSPTSADRIPDILSCHASSFVAHVIGCGPPSGSGAEEGRTLTRMNDGLCYCQTSRESAQRSPCNVCRRHDATLLEQETAVMALFTFQHALGVSIESIVFLFQKLLSAAVIAAHLELTGPSSLPTSASEAEEAVVLVRAAPRDLASDPARRGADDWLVAQVLRGARHYYRDTMEDLRAFSHSVRAAHQMGIAASLRLDDQAGVDRQAVLDLLSQGTPYGSATIASLFDMDAQNVSRFLVRALLSACGVFKVAEASQEIAVPTGERCEQGEEEEVMNVLFPVREESTMTFTDPFADSVSLSCREMRCGLPQLLHVVLRCCFALLNHLPLTLKLSTATPADTVQRLQKASVSSICLRFSVLVTVMRTTTPAGSKDMVIRHLLPDPLVLARLEEQCLRQYRRRFASMGVAASLPPLPLTKKETYFMHADTVEEGVGCPQGTEIPGSAGVDPSEEHALGVDIDSLFSMVSTSPGSSVTNVGGRDRHHTHQASSAGDSKSSTSSRPDAPLDLSSPFEMFALTATCAVVSLQKDESDALRITFAALWVLLHHNQSETSASVASQRGSETSEFEHTIRELATECIFFNQSLRRALAAGDNKNENTSPRSDTPVCFTLDDFVCCADEKHLQVEASTFSIADINRCITRVVRLLFDQEVPQKGRSDRSTLIDACHRHPLFRLLRHRSAPSTGGITQCLARLLLSPAQILDERFRRCIEGLLTPSTEFGDISGMNAMSCDLGTVTHLPPERQSTIFSTSKLGEQPPSGLPLSETGLYPRLDSLGVFGVVFAIPDLVRAQWFPLLIESNEVLLKGVRRDKMRVDISSISGRLNPPKDRGSNQSIEGGMTCVAESSLARLVDLSFGIATEACSLMSHRLHERRESRTAYRRAMERWRLAHLGRRGIASDLIHGTVPRSNDPIEWASIGMCPVHAASDEYRHVSALMTPVMLARQLISRMFQIRILRGNSEKSVSSQSQLEPESSPVHLFSLEEASSALPASFVVFRSLVTASINKQPRMPQCYRTLSARFSPTFPLEDAVILSTVWHTVSQSPTLVHEFYARLQQGMIHNFHPISPPLPFQGLTCERGFGSPSAIQSSLREIGEQCTRSQSRFDEFVQAISSTLSFCLFQFLHDARISSDTIRKVATYLCGTAAVHSRTMALTEKERRRNVPRSLLLREFLLLVNYDILAQTNSLENQNDATTTTEENDSAVFSANLLAETICQSILQTICSERNISMSNRVAEHINLSRQFAFLQEVLRQSLLEAAAAYTGKFSVSVGISDDGAGDAFSLPSITLDDSALLKLSSLRAVDGPMFGECFPLLYAPLLEAQHDTLATNQIETWSRSLPNHFPSKKKVCTSPPGMRGNDEQVVFFGNLPALYARVITCGQRNSLIQDNDEEIVSLMKRVLPNFNFNKNADPLKISSDHKDMAAVLEAVMVLLTSAACAGTTQDRCALAMFEHRRFLQFAASTAGRETLLSVANFASVSTPLETLFSSTTIEIVKENNADYFSHYLELIHDLYLKDIPTEPRPALSRDSSPVICILHALARRRPALKTILWDCHNQALLWIHVGKMLLCREMTGTSSDDSTDVSNPNQSSSSHDPSKDPAYQSLSVALRSETMPPAENSLEVQKRIQTVETIRLLFGVAATHAKRATGLRSEHSVRPIDILRDFLLAVPCMAALTRVAAPQRTTATPQFMRDTQANTHLSATRPLSSRDHELLIHAIINSVGVSDVPIDASLLGRLHIAVLLGTPSLGAFLNLLTPTQVQEMVSSIFKSDVKSLVAPSEEENITSFFSERMLLIFEQIMFSSFCQEPQSTGPPPGSVRTSPLTNAERQLLRQVAGGFSSSLVDLLETLAIKEVGDVERVIRLEALPFTLQQLFPNQKIFKKAKDAKESSMTATSRGSHVTKLYQTVHGARLLSALLFLWYACRYLVKNQRHLSISSRPQSEYDSMDDNINNNRDSSICARGSLSRSSEGSMRMILAGNAIHTSRSSAHHDYSRALLIQWTALLAARSQMYDKLVATSGALTNAQLQSTASVAFMGVAMAALLDPKQLSSTLNSVKSFAMLDNSVAPARQSHPRGRHSISSMRMLRAHPMHAIATLIRCYHQIKLPEMLVFQPFHRRSRFECLADLNTHHSRESTGASLTSGYVSVTTGTLRWHAADQRERYLRSPSTVSAGTVVAPRTLVANLVGSSSSRAFEAALHALLVWSSLRVRYRTIRNGSLTTAGTSQSQHCNSTSGDGNNGMSTTNLSDEHSPAHSRSQTSPVVNWTAGGGDDRRVESPAASFAGLSETDTLTLPEIRTILQDGEPFEKYACGRPHLHVLLAIARTVLRILKEFTTSETFAASNISTTLHDWDSMWGNFLQNSVQNGLLILPRDIILVCSAVMQRHGAMGHGPLGSERTVPAASSSAGNSGDEAGSGSSYQSPAMDFSMSFEEIATTSTDTATNHLATIILLIRDAGLRQLNRYVCWSLIVSTPTASPVSGGPAASNISEGSQRAPSESAGLESLLCAQRMYRSEPFHRNRTIEDFHEFLIAFFIPTCPALLGASCRISHFTEPSDHTLPGSEGAILGALITTFHYLYFDMIPRILTHCLQQHGFPAAGPCDPGEVLMTDLRLGAVMHALAQSTDVLVVMARIASCQSALGLSTARDTYFIHVAASRAFVSVVAAVMPPQQQHQRPDTLSAAVPPLALLTCIQSESCRAHLAEVTSTPGKGGTLNEVPSVSTNQSQPGLAFWAKVEDLTQCGETEYRSLAPTFSSRLTTITSLPMTGTWNPKIGSFAALSTEDDTVLPVLPRAILDAVLVDRAVVTVFAANLSLRRNLPVHQCEQIASLLKGVAQGGGVDEKAPFASLTNAAPLTPPSALVAFASLGIFAFNFSSICQAFSVALAEHFSPQKGGCQQQIVVLFLFWLSKLCRYLYALPVSASKELTISQAAPQPPVTSGRGCNSSSSSTGGQTADVVRSAAPEIGSSPEAMSRSSSSFPAPAASEARKTHVGTMDVVASRFRSVTSLLQGCLSPNAQQALKEGSRDALCNIHQWMPVVNSAFYLLLSNTMDTDGSSGSENTQDESGVGSGSQERGTAIAGGFFSSSGGQTIHNRSPAATLPSRESLFGPGSGYTSLDGRIADYAPSALFHLAEMIHCVATPFGETFSLTETTLTDLISKVFNCFQNLVSTLSLTEHGEKTRESNPLLATIAHVLRAAAAAAHPPTSPDESAPSPAAAESVDIWPASSELTVDHHPALAQALASQLALIMGDIALFIGDAVFRSQYEGGRSSTASTAGTVHGRAKISYIRLLLSSPARGRNLSTDVQGLVQKALQILHEDQGREPLAVSQDHVERLTDAIEQALVEVTYSPHRNHKTEALLTALLDAHCIRLLQIETFFLILNKIVVHAADTHSSGGGGVDAAKSKRRGEGILLGLFRILVRRVRYLKHQLPRTRVAPCIAQLRDLQRRWLDHEVLATQVLTEASLIFGFECAAQGLYVGSPLLFRADSSVAYLMSST